MTRRSKPFIMIDGKQFICPGELARRTGYNVWHIRHMLRENRISGEKLGGEWWIDYATVMRQLRNPRTTVPVVDDKEVDILDGL